MVTLSPRFVRTFRRTTPSAPILALINAALLAFADILFSPFLFAVTVYLLGAETWKVALPVAMFGLAWSLSVPVRAVMARIAPPGRYLATSTGIIRTAAAGLIAWLGYAAEDIDSAVRLADLLLMCYGVYVVAAAFNVPTTRGLIAAATSAIDAVPLFRIQRWLAGLASVLGGIVAVFALRSGELTFYKNVGVIFLLGAVAIAAATWFQFMTTVAATRASAPAATSRGRWQDALGNPAIRRWLGFRFLLGVSTVAEPFLLIYGLRELGFAFFYVAVAIALYAAGQFAAALLLPGWMRGHGPRGMLLTSALLRLLGLGIIALVPTLPGLAVYSDRFDNTWPATLAFVAAFACLGIGSHAQGLGSQRYLYDVVPAASRTVATALANLVLAVTALAPLAGAWLAEQYDLERVVIVALVLAVVGFAASGFLADPEPRLRRARGAWRSRRPASRTA